MRRNRYSGQRWYPGIDDCTDFLECAKYSKARGEIAGIFDQGHRCMLTLKYHKAGLYVGSVLVGKYPHVVAVMAHPSEKIIYARPGCVPDDIVKAYREAVIIDGRWEDQWSED